MSAPEGGIPPPRFPWLGYGLALAVIVLVAIAPLIPASIARVVASANGCVIEPLRVRECRVGGADQGGLLYIFALGQSLLVVTLPVAGIALLAWVGLLVPHRLRWGSRSRMVRPR